MYLAIILQKYSPRNLASHPAGIFQLQLAITQWAGNCFLGIINSGSRAKGTAIALASDVDYMISLTNNCNENSGGLRSIFNSLFTTLQGSYPSARKQNVSVRINISGLNVDITPARKQINSTDYHWVYLSKTGSRQQTNIKKHISDISLSGRTNEIKLLKIWRELRQLDFPSIYLEYLVINVILKNYPSISGSLDDNFWHILVELSKNTGNPLFARIVDPANSANILSDLLTVAEKGKIIAAARASVATRDWSKIVW